MVPQVATGQQTGTRQAWQGKGKGSAQHRDEQSHGVPRLPCLAVAVCSGWACIFMCPGVRARSSSASMRGSKWSQR
jgi:hypothetical protein